MIGLAMLTIVLSFSSMTAMNFWLRFNNPHNVVLGMSYWPGRYYYYTFFPIWVLYFILVGFKFDIYHFILYSLAITLVITYFVWKKKNPNEPLQEQARLIPETRLRFILFPNMIIFMGAIPADIIIHYGLMQ